MDAFKSLVYQVDLITKKEFLKYLQAMITEDTNKQKSEAKLKAKTANADDYITYEEDYITQDSELSISIMSDLNGLNLSSSTRNGISRVWLTSKNEPYSWMSKKGPIVNIPKPLENTPAIKKIMDNLDKEKGLALNSCLVSLYPSQKVSLGLHSDNESTLDQQQPICNLSIGVL